MPPLNLHIQSLQNAQRSAKKRMVTGIVFLAVAYGMDLFAIMLLMAHSAETAVIALALGLLSLVFWCMGIIFMISGIVGQNKAKREIRALTPKVPTPPVQPPVYQPPVPPQPFPHVPVPPQPLPHVPVPPQPFRQVPQEKTPDSFRQ